MGRGIRLIQQWQSERGHCYRYGHGRLRGSGRWLRASTMGWASSGAASVVVAKVRSFVPGAAFGHLLRASRNYREFKGNASAYPPADTQRGGKMIGSAVRISALALGSLDQPCDSIRDFSGKTSSRSQGHLTSALRQLQRPAPQQGLRPRQHGAFL